VENKVKVGRVVRGDASAYLHIGILIRELCGNGGEPRGVGDSTARRKRSRAFGDSEINRLIRLRTPRLSASTVRVTASVAPCPTQRVGATATRSSAEEVPTTVACCVCGGEYEAGARAIVIVLCPVAVGVTQLEDSPASSLSLSKKMHAEICKPLVALQAIVALRAPE
jgi:hypothetical protein